MLIRGDGSRRIGRQRRQSREQALELAERFIFPGAQLLVFAIAPSLPALAEEEVDQRDGLLSPEHGGEAGVAVLVAQQHRPRLA